MPYWEPLLYKITNSRYKVRWQESNGNWNSRTFDYEKNKNLLMALKYLKYLKSLKPIISNINVL